MAVTVLRVDLLGENPTSYLSPFRFEITYECIQPLANDLEWKLTYVGSADDEKFDQVLDCIVVGPVGVGLCKFTFEAECPDSAQIPASEVIGVTCVLLTGSYQKSEFVRYGYFVNNEYDSLELRDPANAPPIPDFTRIRREILADKPRITRYPIDWSDAPFQFPNPGDSNNDNNNMMIMEQNFQLSNHGFEANGGLQLSNPSFETNSGQTFSNHGFEMNNNIGQQAFNNHSFGAHGNTTNNMNGPPFNNSSSSNINGQLPLDTRGVEATTASLNINGQQISNNGGGLETSSNNNLNGDQISEDGPDSEDGESDDIEVEEMEEICCELCDDKLHDDRMLLCDECERGFHMDCLTPPLKEIPLGMWYCDDCQSDMREEEEEAVSS